MTRPKTKCTFDVLLRFVAGFLMTCQNSYIWCIITRKSRFSHDVPKRCKFVALLRGKAGFLMTQPKAKCTFDALLRFVAGFLMTHQKLLYLIHHYVEKQGFSWRTKNMQIYCIIAWKSRFSYDAPKTLKFDTSFRGKAGFMTQQKTKCTFDALLCFVAGFLMTRQQLLYLLHYYVEKQVFPWHAKSSYIWCINTWKSRFSHDATEDKVYFWCISFRSRFSHDVTKTLIFDVLLLGKAAFLMTHQIMLIY